MKSSNSLSELQRKIKIAFASVELKSGHSIRQCVALDNRMDKDSVEFLEFKDYSNWQDIPDWQIERIGTHGVFVHGGVESLVFHLPAAMIYVLHNYEGFLNPQAAYDVYMAIFAVLESSKTIELLGDEQVKAVKEYVSYILDNVDEPLGEDELRVFLGRL